MNRILLPALFLLFFILESLFVQMFPGEVFHSKRIFVPHFLLSAILLLTIYGNKRTALIYGAVFGLLFDVIYTEILGIYLFMFPFISFLVSRMMKVLQSNIIIGLFVTMIGVALLEIGVYELGHLIHLIKMDFMTYLKLRLLPTIVLNFAFVIMAIYPLKRQFEGMGDPFAND